MNPAAVPKSKHWVFTYNNPPVYKVGRASVGSPQRSEQDAIADSLEVWRIFQENSSTFLFYQEEKGENGTPHFQGTCSFANRKELTAVKNINKRIHWEIRKGTLDEAITYCSKKDTKQFGPFEFGDRTKAANAQGRRTDLEAMARVVRERGLPRLAEEDPSAIIRYGRGLQLYQAQLPVVQSNSEREVILLFGPPGCGKTRTYFNLEGSDAPVIDASSGYWFDSYPQGHRCVLLDDFDGRMSKWSLSQVLNIFDRYNRKVPVKGGFVLWSPQRVYVTTNYHPMGWYDWSERSLQYPALKRRFTSILWWRSVGGAPERIDSDFVAGSNRPQSVGQLDESESARSGTDLDDAVVATTAISQWDYFWRGREGLQQELDQQSGRLIARAPQSDYYDF